jgi:hypothetical protein
MMSFIAFGEQDARNLRDLAPLVQPAASRIVETFYKHISTHPTTRIVLADRDAGGVRLREALTSWIRHLFCGTYDGNYFEKCAGVGRTHVSVGLGQHLMLAGLEIIRQELVQVIRRSVPPNLEEKLASLHKLLALDAAVTLEAYKESYSAQVRQTERDLVQDRLTQAEHLAQIGALAASIAHEVKNPLAGISGAIQVIRKDLAPNDPRRPIIAEVLGQIDRLDSAVKDLLLYARPNPPSIRPCDLNSIIDRVLKLLSAEPDMHDIKVEFRPEPHLPPIHADEAQFEQVLINLVLNAAQASREGDTVHITTASSDSTVRLTIRDHGHGMDELVRRRMFEPFFTTKAKGTGLGLSICRKIVEAHHGRTTIESRLGEGTTVLVDMPREPAQ